MTLLAPGFLDRLPQLFLNTAKAVEISDLAFAVGQIGGAAPAAEHVQLLHALAARAGPDAEPRPADFSSRQLVILVWVSGQRPEGTVHCGFAWATRLPLTPLALSRDCLHPLVVSPLSLCCYQATARLKAADGLPAGLLDELVAAIRSAHEAKPLLVNDARNLERALGALGIDSTWITRSEMLNAWSDLADGKAKKPARQYTEEELRAAFEAIDTDKSGDVSFAELKIAIKAINPDADDAAIESMLNFADEDGDMEVSFEEFAMIMRGEMKAKAAVAA